MSTRTIEQLLPTLPFFAGLDGEHLALLAGCTVNVHRAAGELLFAEGEPAETFYVVRSGRVAIQLRMPTGEVLLDTVEPGGMVGWSWLVLPYRWTCDARVSADLSALALDGACLRAKCRADPALGYALLQRVVAVMASRLHSARVRLLDLYGNPV